MFTRFSNPLHQLAQNSQPEKARDKTANYNTTLRHIVYTGLLASGFLLSGYNFIKNRIVQPSADPTKAEKTITENKDVQTISVVSYVNFDTRETLQKNEPRKPVIVETPHLNKPKTNGATLSNGIIRGYLCDENGDMVRSADVLLYKSDELVAVTYTAENGEFIFAGLEAASYSLKILRAGYKELDYPEFEITSNQISLLGICIETVAYNNAGNIAKKTLLPPMTELPEDNQGNKGKLAVTITIKNSVPH